MNHILHPQKFMTFVILPPAPTLPNIPKWQFPFCHYSFYFVEFHINGIISYLLSFCQLLSLSMIILRFIHVIWCVSIIYFFTLLSSILLFHNLFIHLLLMDFWILSFALLLVTCYEHYWTRIFLTYISFHLGKFLRVKS